MSTRLRVFVLALCWLQVSALTAQVRPSELPQPPEGAYDVTLDVKFLHHGIYEWEVTWKTDPPPLQRAGSIPVLEVQNASGGIRITIEPTQSLEIRATSGGQPAEPEDLAFARDGDLFQVLTKPTDSSPIDLAITVPYRMLVRAATMDGAIEYVGFGEAEFETETGEVRLTVPTEATHFELVSVEPPASFRGDARIRSTKGWVATDRVPESRTAWGPITLKAQRPQTVEIRDLGPVPADSPVKMHWQAEEAMLRLFRRPGKRRLKKRTVDPPSPAAPGSADFSANVRLTQLDVTVADANGQPVVGLTAEDFEVIEDGKPQTLTHVESIDAPFNLAVLLDCSDSTDRNRLGMEQAARAFVDVAREEDRVAMYVLANTMFQVLTPLTADHDEARASVSRIRMLGGATPLYDAIVLSYAEEIARLPRERNALVLLTDGLENRIIRVDGVALSNNLPSSGLLVRADDAPSVVSFSRLRRAAREIDTLIYPVILDPIRSATADAPWLIGQAHGWARAVRDQARDLARATGGRVFEAGSITDLDGVYKRVSAELRSVHTVSYRPRNQDFDGGWRRVRVRVDRSKSVVRTRPGYYAH